MDYRFGYWKFVSSCHNLRCYEHYKKWMTDAATVPYIAITVTKTAWKTHTVKYHELINERRHQRHRKVISNRTE